MTALGSSDAEGTIAAIATGVGGALAIVRLSGPDAVAIAGAMWGGQTVLSRLPLRRLTPGVITDAAGRVLDHVLAVRFEAPASYTGETSVEFHCHGGRLVARTVLDRAFALGARPAAPGEFTRRAFLNGKMDLTQAEAVADIVSAGSALALRVAEAQLQGRFGERVRTLWSRLGWVRTEIEARLDFPEEPLDLAEPAELADILAAQEAEVARLLETRRAGDILRHGVRLVIAGPPNTGKSSLMNAILGRDRAIVTPVPGTTRDTLEENISLRGIPICLIDTAGLRDTADEVERQGIGRTEASLSQAGVVLWVMDGTAPLPAQASPRPIRNAPVIRVINKTDLLSAAARQNLPADAVPVSALTGAGLEELSARIERTVWEQPPGDGDLAINERHAFHLERCLQALRDASGALEHAHWDKAGAALQSAEAEVGRVIGKTHSPDILESIFSRFCIGK